MKQKTLVLPQIWRKNAAICPWPKTLVDRVEKKPQKTTLFLRKIHLARSYNFRSAAPWPTLLVSRLNPGVLLLAVGPEDLPHDQDVELVGVAAGFVVKGLDGGGGEGAFAREE